MLNFSGIFFLLRFLNACSISELLLCNWNLTKLNILTLLSSDWKAWALKLNEHLKKRTENVFCLHFANSNFNIIFFGIFSLTLKKLFYVFIIHKIFDNIMFYLSMTVIKVVKNRIFRKKLPSLETNLTLLFFSFLLAQSKFKEEPLNSQQ